MGLKTLLFDIETFGFEYKADKGFLLCGSWKEMGGGSNVHTAVRKNLGSHMWNDKDVCKELSDVLVTADRWITHNGKRFDVRFLNVRLLKHGLPILPPMGKRHIDTCELTWKNLAMRASLKNISEFFELDNKKTPVNLQTWTKAAAGDKAALKEVVKHCEADVLMLEEYAKMIIPIQSETENPRFHECASRFLQKRGFGYNKAVYQRLFCTKCRSWLKGGKIES